MVWFMLLVAAALFLAVLRYGADSRDGLDWRTTAGPSLRQESAPPPGPRLAALRRARRPTLRGDLLRVLDTLRVHRSQAAR